MEDHIRSRGKTSRAGRALVIMLVLGAIGSVLLLPLLLGPHSSGPTALAPPPIPVQVSTAAKPSGPGHNHGASPTPTPALSASSGPKPTAAIPTPTPIASARPPAPTPTPTPKPTATAGTAMPLGDITDTNGTWHQVFTDDFTTPVPVGSFPGTVYGPKWNVYPDGWSDTSHNGRYYPSKVLSVVSGVPGANAGVLNMYLHTENGIHMVAVPVPRLPGTTGFAGQTYGRYSVRFHIDPVPGYKTAWLLWPDSNVWPRDGEIDFPEGNLDRNISAFMHYASASGGQSAFSTVVPEAGAWRIATIEWQPGKVTFILDGRVIGVATTLAPFNPMHFVLQTETCLGCGAPSNTAAGNVQVDWVVIYSRA